MHPLRQSLTVLALSALACGANFAAEITAPGALVKLIDELDVPAPEAGTIIETPLREGAVVAAGDLLVRMDDAEARYVQEKARLDFAISQQRAASEIELRSAERNLVTAAAELKRAEEFRLRIQNGVTETELERLRLAHDQAQLAVDRTKQERELLSLATQQKKAEAEFAAERLERRRIKAIFPGVVVQVHKQRGSWVEPGERILRLIRLDRLRVEAQVDAAAARAALQGRPATFVREGDKTAFVGRVTFVSPEIDPFTKKIRILAEIDNPQAALQPGFRGVLTISTP